MRGVHCATPASKSAPIGNDPEAALTAPVRSLAVGIEADLTRGDWTDPDAGAVNFEKYALRWVDERGLAATTDELYRRLLRLHILSTSSHLDLDEIAPGGWMVYLAAYGSLRP